MSKYDFEVDLSDNSSTGLILNKVPTGSTVLEFGCATGRMTRYMKEALECKVYIVEYEQSAFDIAIQYAEDGVCGDIMKFAWLEKFKDVKFDVIMFADVLEHLMNPKNALVKAKELLKEDGNIYISVPNVTHNDILLKAMGEHFDYTKVGLLDDTHIHFWGLENIRPFAEECGLKVEKIEATYCMTGNSEQFSESSFSVDMWLLKYLRERVCGEVYQFVVTLNTYAENTKQTLKQPVIKSHVYLDKGSGLNLENMIEVDAEYVRSGEYHAHYVIEDSTNIKQVRFDPIEFQGCILKKLSIKQGEKELAPDYIESIKLASGILLNSDDPMVYVNVEEDANAIVIDADILLWGEEYAKIIRNECIIKANIEKDLNECLNLINKKDERMLLLERKIQRYESLPTIRLAKAIKYIFRKLKGVIKSILRK